MDNSDRIFDRSNYSAKTIENFEIVSAYYIDIFYNHLYHEAQKLKASGSVSSVTEGYKHTLNAFLKSLNIPKLYRKSIVGIHKFYMTIGFGTISFAKCVDRLVEEFVPSDYFNSLSDTQKMGVLRMVLNQAIKSLIRKIVDSHMIRIIDNHQEKDNVRILQDEFIDCLILEREGMFQRFIASETKTNRNETVNRLVAEKMQVTIKKLVKENVQYKKEIQTLKKAYVLKRESENKQNEFISDLKQQILELKAQLQKKETLVTHTPNMVAAVAPMAVAPAITTASSAMPFGAPNLTVNTSSLMDAAQSEPNSPQHNSPQENISRGNEVGNVANVVEKSDDNLGSMLDDDDSSFIEVNSGNINNIIKGDSDYIQGLRDSDRFKMDEGTTLADF